MSNVSGVSNVTRPASPPLISGGQLSPEALMLYCASQLKFLDDDIEARMNRQQNMRDTQRGLSQISSVFAQGSLNGTDPESKTRALTALKQTYDSLPPGHPMRADLNRVFQRFVGTGCLNDDYAKSKEFDLATLDAQKIGQLATIADNNGKNGSAATNAIDQDEMKSMGADIEGMIKDLTKGAELEMINLQSLVSQRQLAVQLTTQLLSKINETAMSVASNIK